VHDEDGVLNEWIDFVLGFRVWLPTVNLSPPAMLRERAAGGETLTMDNPMSIQIKNVGDRMKH
jgi:hypothetical protein